MLNIKKIHFKNYINALIIFLLVATPSLKGMLYESSILNFLPLILLIVVILMNKGKAPIYNRLNFAVVPSFLSFLLLSFFVSLTLFGNPIIEDFIKVILILLVTIFLPLTVTFKSLQISFSFLFLWGVFLCVKKVFFVMIFTDNFHYLTVGYPIAIMIIISFYKFFFNKKLMLKIFYFSFIIFGFFTLLTLIGRSPIIFPLFLILLFLIFNFFKEIFTFNISKIIIYLFTFICILLVFTYVINNYIDPYLLGRFLNLLEGSDSRSDAVYLPAIKAITSNFFGYGLGSSTHLIGFYPHNIFLEIALDTGFLGVVFFISILLKGYKNSIKIINMKNETFIILVSIFWLTFLFWNVSYGLSSAYALFSFLSLVICYESMKLNKTI